MQPFGSLCTSGTHQRNDGDYNFEYKIYHLAIHGNGVEGCCGACQPLQLATLLQLVDEDHFLYVSDYLYTPEFGCIYFAIFYISRSNYGV